ncbi:MAG TPA: MlaD family protein [Mycobacteriales bacterium]|nr:MlaD family protein [Mycobacteriales bacterium]
MRGKTLSAFIKLTIFAVVTALATVLLGVVISNKTFGPTRTYRAIFTDATDLLSGNDVRLAGVRVGTVKSVEVMPVRQVGGAVHDEAMVTFSVNSDVPVTRSTRVQVRYLNLVGQRYLALVPTSGSGLVQPTDSIIGCINQGTTTCVASPISRTTPALDLTALFNGFRPLFQAIKPADVNSFALEIVRTLQGEGGTIDSLLKHTASLTTTVANRDAVIGQVVNNLLKVLGTVQARDAGLNETIVELQRLVTGLAGDRTTIAASLKNIDSLATSGTSLIKGARPYLPSDLASLEKIAHTLNTTKDADGQNTLAGFLEREPAKLNRLIRTASYGGYFNFWLCELDVAGLPVTLGPLPGTAPSCPAGH